MHHRYDRVNPLSHHGSSEENEVKVEGRLLSDDERNIFLLEYTSESYYALSQHSKQNLTRQYDERLLPWQMPMME